MMTMPVAMPTRHRIGTAALRSQGPDRRTQFEPGADRLLGIVFVRRGVAEKDERGTPEMPGDESVVAIDRLRDAALKGADRLAQVFEIHAVGCRRYADQFARHGVIWRRSASPCGVGAASGTGSTRGSGAMRRSPLVLTTGPMNR